MNAIELYLLLYKIWSKELVILNTNYGSFSLKHKQMHDNFDHINKNELLYKYFEPAFQHFNH